ncbi:hypothetical protein HYX06_01195 [Candidatus Woesearchaeota archaeon]|nr:hypothetical protein [Candidatus Woesearchaeota archaeon]
MNQTQQVGYVGHVSRRDIEGLVSAIQRAEIEFFIRKFGREIGITRETHSGGQVRYRLRDSDNAPGMWISQERAHEIVANEGLTRMDAYFYRSTRQFYSNF